MSDESITPDGRGRFNHFQGGSIYWTPQTGAHEVHGDIRGRWADMGWERSSLGYPISDEQDARARRISQFEYSSIHWRGHPAPLTYMQHNMALLPPPAAYLGTERGQAITALIENLRRERPDVVGLSECFVDGERQRIKDGLRDLYPYSLVGPDEADLESDGGLLLLSRHAIVQSHQTVFRQCLGEDCLANKGVLHAQIRVSGQPTLYDVFLSHLQNPSPKVSFPEIGPGSTGREKVQRQLLHLASFIKAYNSPNRPCLLMGDLNTNARDAGLYADLKQRLDFTNGYLAQ